MRLFTSLSILLTGALLSSSALAEMATPSMLTNTCVACHGNGGMSQGPAIPSLAGMTENYFIGAMLAYKYDNDPAGLEKALDELIKDKRYEDAEALERFGTIMGRIAKGYTLEEIKAMAPVFSKSEHVPVMQGFDKSKVAQGQDLHEEHCDKCHEDGGLSPADDVGILAGQWLYYLRYTFEDYMNGKRDMPKKMKKAMEAVQKSQGKDGIESLLQYYASVK